MVKAYSSDTMSIILIQIKEDYMLLYRNGRFIAGKASFSLPDDCRLVILDAENYYENGLEITNDLRNIMVVIAAFHEDAPAKDSLDELLESDTFTRLSETMQIRAGELDGYYAFYESRDHIYCEYRFDLEDYEDINSLQIFVTVKIGTQEIYEVYKSQIVQELLAGLRLAQD